VRFHVAAFASTVCIAACGTTVSPHYGQHPDSGTDAHDVQQPTWDAPPPVDVPPTEAAVDAPFGHGPPYPIILHHGFAGFRSIGPLNYFYNVASDLRARGEIVYEAEVAPFASSSDRAMQLARIVDQALADTHSAKVVIIAHSQGGLDARYLISSLHYGDRVALLATVATPHRGTYIADAVLSNSSSITTAILDAAVNALGFAIYDVHSMPDLQAALGSLSQANADAFNRQNPDDSRVVYWSWAGRTNQRTGDVQCSGARFPNDPSHTDLTNPVLEPFTLLLEQGDPVAHVNDGMVEVQSARWGYFMGCVPADHFDEVGQIAESGADPVSGFDHIAFYRTIVQLEHAAGF
jgi:triacylglycerol lipase